MTMDRSSGGADAPRPHSGRSSRPPAPGTTAASSSTSSTEPRLPLRRQPAVSQGDTDIVAGRVARPHGLDGSFHVARPDAELLAHGATVTVAGRRREIVRRAGTDQRPILRLEGLGSRAAAEALRGEPLWVQRTAAPALADDEWWADDLVGLAVRDGEREVGTVARVMSLPSCEVLVVGELLIPLVADAVRSVDVDARIVDVDLAFLGEMGP